MTCSWLPAWPLLAGGHLFYFNLSGDYGKIPADDPHTEVWISDDNDRFESPGSGSPLIGRGFVISADIGTGPNEKPSPVMGGVE